MIVDKYSVLLVFIYMMPYLTNLAEFLFELLWLLKYRAGNKLEYKGYIGLILSYYHRQFHSKKGAIESLIHRHCNVVTMLSFVFS